MNYISNIGGLELYKNVEFPVIVGNPNSATALCVVWQDVKSVMEGNPSFKDAFALIGNLRSPFGVNIILYNLALNPQIKRLVVWGPDKLSNTNVGIAGKNTLVSLWSNGIDDKMQINGTPFRLVDEIDRDVLKSILKNVELKEIGQDAAPEAQRLQADASTKYMNPVRFNEFIVKAPDELPSERYTYLIREKKGADAYLRLLYAIWKYGIKTPFNEGEPDVKEIRDAVVVIENENPEDIYLPDWLLKTKELGLTKESLENYYKAQLTTEPYTTQLFEGVSRFERPKDYSYMYTELIHAFPRPQEVDRTIKDLFENKGYGAAKEFVRLNTQKDKESTDALIAAVEAKSLPDKEKLEILVEGLIPKTDQIANVIDRIKRKSVDLDKEVILWDVRYHSKLESGRPCLMKFSFSVRNERVDMHVFVRSHDIGQGWFYNFYGIVRLLGRVAKESGKRPGFIVVESQSAHIYQKDWQIFEKLIKERIDDAPINAYFDPEKDLDPRGIVNIVVVDGTIKLKLQNPETGGILLELEGKTARQLLYKIKHFDIVSRTDHAVFIGSELAKAEMCLKLGIEYKYDTTIELPNGERLVS
jgi:thymidylate synthase/tetrahydromethanopterin S-methyltransferase subunit A